MALLLEDTRVLDLTIWQQGPFTSPMLAGRTTDVRAARLAEKGVQTEVGHRWRY